MTFRFVSIAFFISFYFLFRYFCFIFFSFGSFTHRNRLFWFIADTVWGDCTSILHQSYCAVALCFYGEWRSIRNEIVEMERFFLYRVLQDWNQIVLSENLCRHCMWFVCCTAQTKSPFSPHDIILFLCVVSSIYVLIDFECWRYIFFFVFEKL